MKRHYQRQKVHKSKTVLTHLNQAGKAAFEEIKAAVLKGYRVENLPSISLILQSVLIQFTKGMSADQLKSLRGEIKAHGCTPPKRHLHQIAKELAIAKSNSQKEQV